MTIKLKTYADNQVLTISDMSNDSFILNVSSNGFSGSVMFYHYAPDFIEAFMYDLVELEASGFGAVKLVDAESNELKFDLNRLGHLEVTGRLIPHSIPRQELIFGFVTDQTCIAPFIGDLRRARS